MRGNGNLNWYATSCSGECPPWFSPYGSANLQATMTSSQDAGYLNLYGPAPIVR